MELITELYEHQEKAVEKLKKIKVGALYMEMGTGKTRTALELIKKRLEQGKVDHVLWLCPCSVKKNLLNDIIKHTGCENKDVITICGIETLSSSIKENVRLMELVSNKECYLIVDESNLVKNFKAKRTKNIIRLSKECKYKMILNGTPISRNEVDLFSQWYIIDWRILGYEGYWSFAANHIEYDERVPGKVRNTLNVNYLVEKIAPYSYQVKKSECLKLPEKTYERVYYDLTGKQGEHYAWVADQLLFSLDELQPHTIYRFFTALQSVISGYNLEIDEELKIYKTKFFKNTVDNPRLECLMDQVHFINENEKIIIFTKYTDEILDITKLLNEKYGEDAAVMFYGELNLRKRNESLEKFKNKSRFLVANKQCGAYGLNLQMCSYLIYYSNDWDYATRSQSEDRVHRIGQNKNVHILDIVADSTLDERIIGCLERKEGLVESFKNELEEMKDSKDIYSWIRRQDFYGKKYSKKIYHKDCKSLLEID